MQRPNPRPAAIAMVTPRYNPGGVGHLDAVPASRQRHRAKRDIRPKQLDITAIDTHGPPRCKKVSHEQQARAVAQSFQFQPTVIVEENPHGAIKRAVALGDDPRVTTENHRQRRVVVRRATDYRIGCGFRIDTEAVGQPYSRGECSYLIQPRAPGRNTNIGAKLGNPNQLATRA